MTWHVTENNYLNRNNATAGYLIYFLRIFNNIKLLQTVENVNIHMYLLIDYKTQQLKMFYAILCQRELRFYRYF